MFFRNIYVDPDDVHQKINDLLQEFQQLLPYITFLFKEEGEALKWSLLLSAIASSRFFFGVLDPFKDWTLFFLQIIPYSIYALVMNWSINLPITAVVSSKKMYDALQQILESLKIENIEQKLREEGYTGSIPLFMRENLSADGKLIFNAQLVNTSHRLESCSKASYLKGLTHDNVSQFTGAAIISCVPNVNLDLAIADWIHRITTKTEGFCPPLVGATFTKSENTKNTSEFQLEMYGYNGPLPCWMLDPVTKKIMMDPVIDPITGQSFEKATYQPSYKAKFYNLFKSTQPLPNQPLKEAISEWINYAVKNQPKKQFHSMRPLK